MVDKDKKYDMVKYEGKVYQLSQFYSIDYILMNIEYMVENNDNILGKVDDNQPDNTVLTVRKCDKCGELYIGYPAISRKDSSEICSQCGVIEAITALKGV